MSLSSSTIDEGMMKWESKVIELERNNNLMKNPKNNPKSNPWSKLNPYNWISIKGVLENCPNCDYRNCTVFWKSDKDDIYILYKMIKCMKCLRKKHLSVDVY